MAREWYVLRVQSGRENTVRNTLGRRIQLAGLEEKVASILVPTENVTEIKSGRKRVKERKLYPGYVLVEMELTDEVWFIIRDTPGIGDFVGAYGRPVPMQREEVARILQGQQEKEEAPVVKIELEKGQHVKIKEGPFENFDAVVDEVFPEKGVVKVIVNIFSRATPVELEYWQVERI
ncbi:MAG TPA: transcription termination/antitermination factor NusG [Planctomycetes bacterium]|jgi:transcriptional antiterminator NusG|nr:transcription termination/antitermination factor NusG [Planctomycetota bacterium]